MKSNRSSREDFVHQLLNVCLTVKTCHFLSYQQTLGSPFPTPAQCLPCCQDYSNSALLEEGKREYQVPITAVSCLLAHNYAPIIQPPKSEWKPIISWEREKVCVGCWSAGIIQFILVKKEKYTQTMLKWTQENEGELGSGWDDDGGVLHRWSRNQLWYFDHVHDVM